MAETTKVSLKRQKHQKKAGKPSPAFVFYRKWLYLLFLHGTDGHSVPGRYVITRINTPLRQESTFAVELFGICFWVSSARPIITSLGIGDHIPQVVPHTGQREEQGLVSIGAARCEQPSARAAASTVGFYKVAKNLRRMGGVLSVQRKAGESAQARNGEARGAWIIDCFDDGAVNPIAGVVGIPGVQTSFLVIVPDKAVRLLDKEWYEFFDLTDIRTFHGNVTCSGSNDVARRRRDAFIACRREEATCREEGVFTSPLIECGGIGFPDI